MTANKPFYQTTKYAAFVVSDESDPHTGFLAVIRKRMRVGYGEQIEATCMSRGVVKDRVKNMSRRRMARTRIKQR